MGIKITEVIGEFSTSSLEGIRETGNYVIHGFRPGGPRSKLKRQRLKTELPRKDDIVEKIKLYGKQQVESGYLDNTWTFVNNIDKETINNRIKNNGREAVFLELFSNNRMDVIKEILPLSKGEKNEVVGNGDSDQELIANLRSIIVELEKDRIKRDDEILFLREINRKTKSDILLLKNQKSIINKKIKKIESNKGKAQSEKASLKLSVEELQERNKKLISDVNQFDIYIVGGDRIKDWFKQNSLSERFQYVFLNLQTEELIGGKIADEIWLIKPYIDMEHMQLINNNILMLKMNLLQRKFIFNDLDEVKAHMVNLEAIE